MRPPRNPASPRECNGIQAVTIKLVSNGAMGARPRATGWVRPMDDVSKDGILVQADRHDVQKGNRYGSRTFRQVSHVA
jgi:hypothetical protein